MKSCLQPFLSNFYSASIKRPTSIKRPLLKVPRVAAYRTVVAMPSTDILYLEMTIGLKYSMQDHMVEQQSTVEFL